MLKLSLTKRTRCRRRRRLREPFTKKLSRLLTHLTGRSRQKETHRNKKDSITERIKQWLRLHTNIRVDWSGLVQYSITFFLLNKFVNHKNAPPNSSLELIKNTQTHSLMEPRNPGLSLLRYSEIPTNSSFAKPAILFLSHLSL